MEGHRGIIRGREEKLHPSNQEHTQLCTQSPLQRQSVPFVCQIFHDKTVAAFSTVKEKLGLSEGTIIFVNPIWTNGTDLARFKKTLFSETF